MEAQVYNPKMTSTEFAELAKLCQDQSALGSNLLSMAKSLSDQPSPQSKKVASFPGSPPPLYNFYTRDFIYAKLLWEEEREGRGRAWEALITCGH